MLEIVSHWVIEIISSLGYLGVVLTMAIESALIPLPSEIIMPFSGYLASTGQFNIHLVAFSGALGNLIGSWISYAIGYYGGEVVVRSFLRKWGRYILHTEHDLDDAEKLLRKNEDWVVFGSRMLPGIRTVISLPCGMAKLPLLRFSILTFAGSLIWSYFLAWIGLVMGSNWDTLGPYFHKADAIIVILIVLTGGWYIWHKWSKIKKHSH